MYCVQQSFNAMSVKEYGGFGWFKHLPSWRLGPLWPPVLSPALWTQFPLHQVFEAMDTLADITANCLEFEDPETDASTRLLCLAIDAPDISLQWADRPLPTPTCWLPCLTQHPPTGSRRYERGLIRHFVYRVYCYFRFSSVHFFPLWTRERSQDSGHKQSEPQPK